MGEHPRGHHHARSSSATQPGQPLCPVCWTPFTPVGRQRYCTDACRKTAWTRRQAAITRPSVKPPVRQAIRGHDATIYACPSCQTRYHREQWCHHCRQPCTRVGLGGLCPHCDAPVAVTDLLDTAGSQAPSTASLSTPPGGEFR
jgi:hypothetical protein